MTMYKCKSCKHEKEVSNLSIKVIDGKVVCPETLCKCGEEMEDTEGDNGMPNIIRNESSAGKIMLKRMRRK
tara:strand:- start:39 stop:251 length:213 start_codon:yes stop_codon:yes gene_type:complete